MQVVHSPVKHDLDYAVTLARYYHRDQFIGGSSYFDAHTSLVIEHSERLALMFEIFAQKRPLWPKEKFNEHRNYL
jgi:hypothetical protein